MTHWPRPPCASGYLHLLLGHHAADQAETVTMRLARGPHGAEGIAPWSARNKILLLRPLLTIPPQELRAYLAATNMEWIEDPSNQNPKFERVRIRQAGTTRATRRPRPPPKRASLKLQPSSRATPVSAPKALRCSTRRPHRLPHFAALIRALGGASHPPRRDALAGLAAKLRPATLGGVRILPAGRLGSGWLLIREPAALAAPIPAHSGALWDDRFMLAGPATPDQIFGALGADCGKFKNHNHLPTVILRTMPCLRNLAGDITFPIRGAVCAPRPGHIPPILQLMAIYLC